MMKGYGKPDHSSAGVILYAADTKTILQVLPTKNLSRRRKDGNPTATI